MKVDFDFSLPNEKLNKVRRHLALLSTMRLTTFLGLIAVVIVGLSDKSFVILGTIPVAAFFIYLVRAYNSAKDKENFMQALIQMTEESRQRAKREFSALDPGTEFKDDKHPFSSDLDLFGNHSLFQLLNHTVSAGGKKLLADWFIAANNPSHAQYRRGAVKELGDKKDFLIKFEGLGRAFYGKEKSKKALYDWLRGPSAWKGYFWIPAILGPTVGLSLLVGIFTGVLAPSYLSLHLLAGAFFLSLVFRPLMKSMKAMPNESDLKSYTAWAYLMEDTAFEHPYLKKLQDPICDVDFQASEALKSMEQQSFIVQNRANLMYLIFNFLFWTDFWVLFRLEKWRAAYGGHMEQWEKVFEEWEVLVSLGAYTATEAVDCPITWTDRLIFSAKNLRHPLIAPEVCVGNDFTMSENERVVLLTGSNMSGKTTFMRTVGINLVMANLGLSPLADEFTIGPFQLFTSMRNSDNLGESVSSFYAELSRIKNLLHVTSQQTPVYYLLDEILKGTNTADRVMGSRALIRQLLLTHAKGIISTHDVELNSLEKEMSGVVNMSFHHQIEDDKIVFDYKIKSGSCPNFNAQKLMELMGISFQ